jgi:hypothetical protein
MSLLKTVLKQEITFDIGVRVDDAKSAAERELQQMEGRHAAFLDGAKAIEALHAFVDKDVEEEQYDLKTAEVAKRFITRACNAMQNLATQATHLKLAQAGKLAGFDHTIKLLKGMLDAEKAKIQAMQDADPNAPVTPRDRPTGQRPNSLKEQRLAEEMAEAPTEAPPVEGAVEEASRAPDS